MRTRAKKNGSTRRSFLQMAGLAGAAMAATLWLPKRARGAPAPGSVKRVILIDCKGAPRWTASFDAQSDVKSNPWGLMSWTATGAAAKPAWGFSRMFLQKPLAENATNWTGTIYPYLTSDDASHYNVNRPALTTWGGAPLPNIADVASEIAVVRVTSNPGGQFNGDHGSAQQTLHTGFLSGQTGMVTALQYLLKQQLGGRFDAAYPLPAVAIGEPGWSYGVDQYAGSRPIFLSGPTAVPASSPKAKFPPFSLKLENDLDAPFQTTRQAFTGQAVADLVNDKANGDAHLPQLVNPALHLATPPAMGMPSPSLGTTVDGTPVTNAMLAELFALDSASAAAGDIFFDVFAAQNETTTPSWTLTQNQFGLNAAIALRLLQTGAPVVSIQPGYWDSHSNEVIDPGLKRPQTTQMVMLGRILAGLEFALKRIADPVSPSASLWDSTVICVVGEFGRGGPSIGSNGFNSPNGQNDGGSDHDPWSAWPLCGGPVTAGGKLLQAPTSAGNPQGFYAQNQVFTTLIKGLGIDDSTNSYLPSSSFPTISNLIAGV